MEFHREPECCLLIHRKKYILNQILSSLSRIKGTSFFTIVIGAQLPSLRPAEKADNTQVLPFSSPFCDAFTHQSSLPTLLLWLTFLTAYMLFPTSPFLSHPYSSYHPKTPCPKPPGRGPCQPRLPPLLAEPWDRLRCPFWTHGEGICAQPPAAVASSNPQPFHAPSLPFSPAAGAIIPPSPSSPEHSGPQLFDQVMVP